MISAICADIISAITGLTGVKSVGAWAGDVDSLLQMPQNLPGLYLVYNGADFDEGPATMGTVKVDTDMSFQVLLIVNNPRSPAAAATAAWTIMELVRAALIGRQVLTYDKLWPVKEDLIFSEGGLLVYSMDYTLDARTT